MSKKDLDKAMRCHAEEQQRDVNGPFVGTATEAAEMGLVLNEGKTEYILSTGKDFQHRRHGQKVTVDRYTFEVIKDPGYFAIAISSDIMLKSNEE